MSVFCVNTPVDFIATVTLQLEVKFVPSTVVAVILHVPFPTGVIFPLPSTFDNFV